MPLKDAIRTEIASHVDGITRAELNSVFNPGNSDFAINRALVELRDEGKIACTNGVWWARTARTARV